MQTPDDSSFNAENDRERERMRSIVERLSDVELAQPVNDAWTVAGVLGHVAFWDARATYLAHKIARGEPFSRDEVEPDDVDWINDSARPFILALAPRDAANLALQIADETDALVASLDPARVWPNDPNSLLNAFRSQHRGEHLDEIEAVLSTHAG